MIKIIEGLKHYWLLAVMVCLIGLGAVSTLGCAGRTRSSTVTTETTGGVAGTSTVTTEREVTTSSHPRGVIGGLFYTIGQVLLFPFKLIGSLFS